MKLQSNHKFVTLQTAAKSVKSWSSGD